MKIVFQIRSIVSCALYPFFMLIISSVVILQNIFFAKRKWEDAIISFWGRTSCRMFGVDVQVRGLENIPSGGAVFLFNHTSFFDIFAMSGYLPSIRFGAKIELFSIPVFGRAMMRAGMLPIARERRNEVIRVYEAASERILNGERFALAPEGTRQIIEKLGPFKSGPFIFALNTGAMIVPVVIKGAAAILPKGSVFPNWGIRNRRIDLIVLPAFETSSWQIEQRRELQEQVRNSMLVHFEANQLSN